MRGRCFIGTYGHQRSALVGIGSHGPANITANIFSDYGDSRLAVERIEVHVGELKQLFKLDGPVAVQMQRHDPHSAPPAIKGVVLKVPRRAHPSAHPESRAGHRSRGESRRESRRFPAPGSQRSFRHYSRFAWRRRHAALPTCLFMLPPPFFVPQGERAAAPLIYGRGPWRRRLRHRTWSQFPRRGCATTADR
jgi:hypothetical protein